MALKVELKPNERIIVGKAVIRNGDSRTRIFIEGDAPILREKDILTATTANSPAKRIYLSVQLMYLAGDTGDQHDAYFSLVRDFLAAAPSAMPLISEISDWILAGELYRALRSAKQLLAYEEKLISGALGGGAAIATAEHAAAL
ncbi:MAG: flagellar biosynthesis repressor FlbT [Beijerinckiaceae bacterium]